MPQPQHVFVPQFRPECRSVYQSSWLLGRNPHRNSSCFDKTKRYPAGLEGPGVTKEELAEALCFTPERQAIIRENIAELKEREKTREKRKSRQPARTRR